MSPWIEAARRGDVITLINHGQEKQNIDVRGVDAITGAPVNGIELEAFDWCMLKVDEI